MSRKVTFIRHYKAVGFGHGHVKGSADDHRKIVGGGVEIV